MFKAEVMIELEYAEAFDFEDLRAIFHRVLAEAHEHKKLDLPAAGNDGVEVKCVSVGRVWPEWID